MKQDNQLSFQISGEIYRTESNLEKYSSDNELVSILNERKYEIQRELESELYKYAAELGIVERVKVEIHFERGSILATGWIIIDYLGKIAGAVSFFEYLGRIARYISSVTQRAINRNLPSSGTTYRTSINVIPTGYPNLNSSRSNDDGQLNLFNMSPSKLLTSITLINIMLFIGGTLFTTIEIPSILKKYEEAEAKFKVAKAQCDSADLMLKTAKLDYQFKKQEIENIRIEVLQEKEAILNSLSADTLLIKANITNIDTRLTLLSNQINDLNKNKNKYEGSLSGLNESIAKLQANKVTFNFIDVWRYMNLWLRLIVAFVVLATLSTIISSTHYLIQRIRH